MYVGEQVMEASKIKNIILVILLLLNIFLLSIFFLDRSSAASSENAAEDSVIRTLENNGISVGKSVDMGIDTPSVYQINRDMGSEKALIEKLLRSTKSEDLGGNIIFYSSGYGQASLRGTGEMDILFTSDLYEKGKSSVKTAIKVMDKLGLQADEDRVENGDDASVVELLCMWQDCPVYNARLSFTFGGGQLLMITGTRILDNATEQTDTEVMDILSATLRFLELTREEGFVCSSLDELEVGYIMSVPVSGESTLTPVWHFVTNAGGLYINAVSGRLESVE